MNSNFQVVPRPAPQTRPFTILITGASRGLGFELVKQYATEYKTNIVIAAVRDPSKAESLVEFAKTHTNVHIISIDTSKEESIKNSINQLPKNITHIDYLFNNAGIMGTPASSLSDVNGTEIEDIFKINVAGPFLMVATYQHLLVKSEEPKVINVSSGLGSSTLAGNVAQWGTIPYGASKAALNYLNQALKTALPQITFLAISPGWVQTDMGGTFGTVAPVTVVDSVSGLRALAQSKGKEDSGKFFDVITGEIYPY